MDLTSVVKAIPTPGSVHVNRPLTQISIAFHQSQSNFIAMRVFANIPVTKSSDLYYEYDRGFFNRDEAEKRAPGTEAAGGGFKVTTSSYNAETYAYRHDIPDQRRENTDNPLAPDTEAVQLVSMKMLLLREKSWKSAYFGTGKWTTDVAGVSGVPGATEVKQWNDAASTPIQDIRAGIDVVLESTGFEPNTLVLGHQVATQLFDHPDIVDRVKYGQTSPGPAMIDVPELMALFKIPRIFIMKAIENTAAEGASNSHSFIGGKSALLCYSTPTPGLQTPSAGYTFSWTGMQGGIQGNRIKKYRLERIESDRIEIQSAYDMKKIAADLGYFFGTIVA